MDITKAAWQGDGDKRSPIYTGALGTYNNIIFKTAYDVTSGVNSSTGAAITTVKRAVLLGGQAAVIGYGMKHAGGKYLWNEELFDVKRRLEIASLKIYGIKKARFNATDYGVIVLSTYAAAHT